MENLKGKKAIITGGSRGLGKATAIAFANQGIDVAITGRNEADLKETVAELKALGVNATYATFDIGNYEEVKKGIQEIMNTFNTVDILVNNAGIAAFGKFLELEPSEWERIIQVNLMGVYYVTRAILPNMIERQTGDIINISSTAGLNGNALTSAYSASKFALLGLTDSLMQEMRKHNIRVTALTPSTVATDMAKELNLTDGNPEKVMQAEDIAELLIAQLKLNRRVFIKNSSIWSTNP